MKDNQRDPKMLKYGFYEVSVPVWNPLNEEPPVTLTVDVYGDEETLEEINPYLRDAVVGYVAHAMKYQETIGDYLLELLHHDLVMDAMCDEFLISSTRDLEHRLQCDGFEVFPL